MITQERIENIILKVICDKIDEKNRYFENLNKENIDILNNINEQWEKLEHFQSRHWEELQEIYDVNDSRTQCLGYKSHFGAVFHELGGIYENCKYHIKQNQESIDKMDGFTVLTYKEIENSTGLNTKSIKKYCDILFDKGKILRKKVIGGIGYKLAIE